MATVQTLLDVLLIVHGVVTTSYGTLALLHPAMLDVQASPPAGEPSALGRWHPATPARHSVPGILHETMLLALEAGQHLPGVAGPFLARYSGHWQDRLKQGFYASSHETAEAGTSHALWFRLYGLHTLMTGVVAVAMALGTHDRKAKVTTAVGMWLYTLFAWLVVCLDVRAGGAAAHARGASLVLGSLVAVYTLVLAAIYTLWPRAAGQGTLFARESHVHHHERQAEHEKRHQQ